MSKSAFLFYHILIYPIILYILCTKLISAALTFVKAYMNKSLYLDFYLLKHLYRKRKRDRHAAQAEQKKKHAAPAKLISKPSACCGWRQGKYSFEPPPFHERKGRGDRLTLSRFQPACFKASRALILSKQYITITLPKFTE